MNREEEIKKAAEETSKAMWDFIDDDYTIPFKHGAQWADSHPVNQWRKAEDELPPRIKETVNVSKAVLVTNGLSYGTGYYNYNLNKWFSVGTTNITHWMELPELPKEE